MSKKGNLDIYNALRRPPGSALNKIKGGRLNGMTDIKPQWRIEAVTELFGPCGVGWRYEIVSLWIEEGYDGIRIANALIHFSYLNDGEWSEPVPGIGGSMLVAKETAGLYSSDEAYKMAVTDALSVAMKQIGTAADIYAGLWDGSKYSAAPAHAIPVIGQISGEPVDMERVAKAVNYLKQQIDEDHPDDAIPNIKKAWERLDNDERLLVQEGLKDKAPGTNRMYKNILKDYINHTGEAE